MGTIFKRKSSDGKLSYTARVRKRGFPALSATFSRLTDAKAWVEQEEVKIRQGIYLDFVEAKKHTLAEAIDRYIREGKPHVNRLLHLKRWRVSLGSLFLSAISEVRINDVTATWRHDGVDEKALEPATINRHLNSLSVVLTYAREWGWVRQNPVRDARKFKEPRGIVRFLSDEERKLLLDACREDEYRPIYLIVVLALSTGMRKEELLSLTWSQVDLAKWTLLLVKTKNGERRKIPVRGLALELLTNHAKIRRIDSDFLFPGENPSPHKECQKVNASARHFDIRKPWQRVIKRAKIVDFRFHDLRHSCASYLAMNGASLLEIAEVLGHKTLEVVKRYAHLADSHTAGVVERMNRKIFG